MFNEVISMYEVEIINQPPNDTVLDGLTTVLCGDDKELFDDLKTFWTRWFTNKIEGNKITVFAQVHKDDVEIPVGVVRFWSTPYLDGKWLVEGLEVLESHRKKHVGLNMMELGLSEIKNMNIGAVSANIDNENIASIELHKKLGFKKVSEGSLNSYGDYREHIDEYVLNL